MYFLHGIFIMYPSFFLSLLPAILSLLSSVLSYPHSSSRWLWPVWTKLLPWLQWGWNFPLLQKVPSAACAVPGGRVMALAVMWSAMACMPGSSKHEPGCFKVFLVYAESQFYWGSLKKMKICCMSLRKNLEISMVILSWPNLWECVLKANTGKTLKLAERMTFLRLFWIPDLIFLVICQSLCKSIFKVFTRNLYPRETAWLKFSILQIYILPYFFWK